MKILPTHELDFNPKYEEFSHQIQCIRIQPTAEEISNHSFDQLLNKKQYYQFRRGSFQNNQESKPYTSPMN